LIKNNYGIIIDVNLGSGKYGFDNLSAYCASRFGLIGLAKSVTLEAHHTISESYHMSWKVNTIMWRDFDSSYHKLNNDKMLKPQQVAEKIVHYILNPNIKRMKNGVNMYMIFNIYIIQTK